MHCLYALLDMFPSRDSFRVDTDRIVSHMCQYFKTGGAAPFYKTNLMNYVFHGGVENVLSSNLIFYLVFATKTK